MFHLAWFLGDDADIPRKVEQRANALANQVLIVNETDGDHE